MAENGTLTTRQRRALTAILGAPTLDTAAAACGIARRSLERYLSQPDFRAALVAAEAQALDQAGRVLVAGQAQALAVLADVMSDPNARPGDRRAAAVAWLDLVLKWREQRVLEERIAVLEAALHDNRKSNR